MGNGFYFYKNWKNKVSQRRVKRWVLLLTAAGMPFSISGCYDRQELEQQAFVTTLGIDAAPHGLIDCTFRIAMPVNPSGGGGSASSTAGPGAVTYRAHTINEAMLLANTSIERSVTFSHLTQILFGQKLAEQGLLPEVQTLLRFREFRQTVAIGVTKGNARELLAADNPMLEQSANRVADSVGLIGKRTGLFPVTYIHDLANALETEHEDIAAPCYAINPSVQADPKGKESIQEAAVSYQAGKVPRAGGNPVEFAGAAIFHGDKVVDFLNARQALDYRVLTSGIHNGKVDFLDPNVSSQRIGVSLHSEQSPQYQVRLSKPLQITVNVPIDADLINIESGVDYARQGNIQRLQTSLNQQLNTELTNLLRRILMKDQSNCIPVVRFIRPEFATQAEFVRYPWEEQLSQAQIHVQTDLKIRRFGIQLEPVKAHV